MSPLAVITAIVLGSAVAIGFGLCTVLFMAWLLKGQSDQLASEVKLLPVYCALFIALSSIAAAALYGIFKQLSWRWLAQLGMWGTVVLVALLSWRR